VISADATVIGTVTDYSSSVSARSTVKAPHVLGWGGVAMLARVTRVGTEPGEPNRKQRNHGSRGLEIRPKFCPKSGDA
jgi:hypothetical protein